MNNILHKWVLILIIIIATLSCSSNLNEIDYDLIIKDYISASRVDLNLNPTSKYFVILGDIQTYTGFSNNHPFYSYLLKTMAWIYTQNRALGNIDAILQVGDITQTNDKDQWDRYSISTTLFENDIPILVCTGNHDYDWVETNEFPKIKDRNTTLINNYSPNKKLESIIVNRYEELKIENYIAQFCINNYALNVVVLEFGVRPEVLKWLQNVLENDPDGKYIIMTHEHLRDGKIQSKDSCIIRQLQNSGNSYTIPEILDSDIVKQYDNVIGTICGHSGFYECQYTKKLNGLAFNLLFNLQFQENGGNGLILLCEFPNSENIIKINLYDTLSNQIIDREKNEIVIEI